MEYWNTGMMGGIAKASGLDDGSRTAFHRFRDEGDGLPRSASLARNAMTYGRLSCHCEERSDEAISSHHSTIPVFQSTSGESYGV